MLFSTSFHQRESLLRLGHSTELRWLTGLRSDPRSISSALTRSWVRQASVFGRRTSNRTRTCGWGHSLPPAYHHSRNISSSLMETIVGNPLYPTSTRHSYLLGRYGFTITPEKTCQV